MVIVDGENPCYLSLRAATLLANADVAIGDGLMLDAFHQSIGHNAEQISLVNPSAPLAYTREVTGAIDRHRDNTDVIIIRLIREDEVASGEMEIETNAIKETDWPYEVVWGASVLTGNDAHGINLPREGPLVGMSVLITRARHQVSRLGDLLLEAGARPIIMPAIEITVGAELRAHLGAVLKTARPEWVVFSSQNAVVSVLSIDGSREFLTNSRVACVGPATAAACEREGISVELLPTTFSADALIDEFPRANDRSGLVLFFAGQIAGPTVVDGLETKGYLVERVDTYETHRSAVGPYLRHRAHGADAVIFTSASTVEGTIAALGKDHLPKRVISIGPKTSAAARAHGLIVSAESGEQRLESLITTLVDDLTRHG
jgi:uroporphyrinogen-III synthase